MRLRSTLDGARVDADLTYPIEIKRNAGIWQQRAPGEMRNRSAGVV
jgi:hypothetical protein